MTIRDYRDLLDLMMDGVEYRKHRKHNPDPDAVVCYWSAIDKLYRTLPDGEKEKLSDARIANMEAQLDKCDRLMDAAKEAMK